VGTRGLLIDDELEILLGQISAKKLMIIDACHSGSFYKGLNEGYTIKVSILQEISEYEKWV